ncbi:MAG TPA: response regulator [Stellaceae bacterium]|nr:response regulator [Stellaceae bacterium]
MATILIVDDDGAIRDSMRIVLEQKNHEVVLAENGDAAVRCYASARPDVVITDLLLPAKDGIEIVREIRRIDPKARVIAMSGGGESAEARLLTLTKEFGALETLSKPFRVAQLVAVIERTLNPPPPR